MTLGTSNKLTKVKDESTIFSLLSGTKELNSEVFIWKLIGNNKHLGQVRIESIRKLRRDFCIIPGDGQDRIVQDLLSSQNYVDLYIPDSALLLRCQIKTTDAPHRYYLQIPEFVAQAERRQHLRLNLTDQNPIKVSFGKTVTVPRTMSQHFLKDCYDVSSGGFSFYISKLETKFFHPGDEVPGIEIKAGGWSTKVSGEITTIREIEPDAYNGLPYKVWRVSFKFKSIDQVSRKYLEKFIFERIKEELHVINE